MKKTVNHKLECLREWGAASVDVITQMTAEGKSQSEITSFLQLSMQAAELMKTVLERSGNVNALITAMSK